MKLSYLLMEGRYDHSIFKAIFIVGSPGAGKSWVIDNLGIQEFGLKLLDSDREFVYYLKKLGKSLKIDPTIDPELPKVRDRAIKMDDKFKSLYLSGRLGIVVSGTGYNFDAIANKKKELEDLGYDTYIIFVNTKLDVAMKRNRNRERSLGDDVVSSKWVMYMSNIGRLQSLFGADRFFVFDNTDENTAIDNIRRLYKTVSGWVHSQLSYTAKSWISKNI